MFSKELENLGCKTWVCLEGKPRTPLSSRVATRVSWSPLSGLKGLCPGLEARFPARRREERGCGPVTGKDRASCQSQPEVHQEGR